MGKIKVLNAGLLSSFQDLGRIGYQQFGVPISGAMDPYSHQIANWLVGNNASQPTLEVTFLGPTLQFESNECIAITGGNLTPKLNGVPIPMWENIKVTAGDCLSFGQRVSGVRSYISFSGQLQLKKIMGSYSYYKNANIGKSLNTTKNFVVHSTTSKKKRSLPGKYRPTFIENLTCKVILGPQDEWLKKESINLFFKSTYTLTNDSNRMGYRLNGAKLFHKKTADIISEGLSPGAIQVPGNGEPIIMMADAQTTGGYCKLGYIVTPDLPLLSQLAPNDKVRFEKISISEARDYYKNYITQLKNIRQILLEKEKLSIDQYKIKINGNTFDVSIEEID